MPTFRQGDVVRVPFPYTDRETRQHRPALVVSNGTIGRDGRLLWVVMITNSQNAAWDGDLMIDDIDKAGLPIPSIIRATKIATIEASHAEPVGVIGAALLSEVIGAVAGIVAGPER